MEPRETEIDLIDFMFEAMSHWRGLLACLLIGAVLGGGYSFVKSASAPVEEVTQATAADYEKKLSEDEIRDVNAVLQKKHSHLKLIVRIINQLSMTRQWKFRVCSILLLQAAQVSPCAVFHIMPVKFT